MKIRVGKASTIICAFLEKINVLLFLPFYNSEYDVAATHKFEIFIVTTSTLAQVRCFAQKLFWSSFKNFFQCLGTAQ